MSSKKKKKKKKPFLCYLKIQQKKQPFKNTSVSSNKPLHLGKQQKKPWPSRPSPKSGSHCSCPSTSQNLPSSAGETRDLGSIPGSKRSPGGGHSNPLQYSWLKNSVDRRAWQATVHGVAKSRMQLSDLAQHTQFSRSVVSDSSWPHGLQHTRPPCPSTTPRVHPNSCPLSQWCHPTISYSVVPFSCLPSFPASGSFLRSQFFASGGQSIGTLASASVLPMNIQDWFPLGWTGWISLQSRDSKKSSPTPQFKSINSLVLSFLYGPTLKSIHDYWKKTQLWLYGPLLVK